MIRGGEEDHTRKRRKIFGPQNRRRTEKEKGGNIWSTEEKKEREGKLMVGSTTDRPTIG